MQPELNTQPTSFYFVAGEVSGDHHAAHLWVQIKKQLPTAVLHGVGGVHLKDAGQNQLFDLVEHAVVGLTDVLKNYFKFRDFFLKVIHDIVEKKPEVLVLVDYPGFNLRLAKKIRRLLPNTKIVYYISPQVWAWKKHRSKMMSKCIDLLLVIFEFEKEWFTANEPTLNVKWVGHPILDRWHGKAQEEDDGNLHICLMPGSRKREIARHLPVLLETAQRVRQNIPNTRFIILATNEESANQITDFAHKYDIGGLHVEVVYGYQLTHLSRADLALVASGTATIECCVATVPMMILYQVHPITYWVGKMLVNIPYLGMVNVLAGEKLVPEFLQEKAHPDYLVGAVQKVLKNPTWLKDTRKSLEKIRTKLGSAGASQRASQQILNLLPHLTTPPPATAPTESPSPSSTPPATTTGD